MKCTARAIPLWVIGVAVLGTQVLGLLSIAAAAYLAFAGIGWLFAVDLLDEEYQPALAIVAGIWAPVATGRVKSAMSSRMVVVCVGEGSTQEELNRSYAHALAFAGSDMSEVERGSTSISALAMVTLGILAANLAPFVLLIEFIEWLTSSEWPGLTLADGLALFGIIQEVPESDSQRLIDLALAVPLSISLFAVGLFLCIAGFNLGDRSVRPQRDPELLHRE